MSVDGRFHLSNSDCSDCRTPVPRDRNTFSWFSFSEPSPPASSRQLDVGLFFFHRYSAFIIHVVTTINPRRRILFGQPFRYTVTHRVAD